MIYTIIFEGVDRTGKTTLKEAFNKATKFKYLVFDRGIVSYVVYNKIYERRNYIPATKFFDNLHNSIVVLVEASKTILVNRMKNTNHPMIHDIEKEMLLFRKTVKILGRYRIPYIILKNNIDEDVNHCINQLKKRIKDLNEV